MMPKLPDQIAINGRFLTQGLTGVQRVAYELVWALDHLLSQHELPPALQNREWVMYTPRDAPSHFIPRNIRLIETGRLKGHAWEQTELWWAARHAVLLNFCNSAPLLHPRQYVMIHDAAVYRHPEFYSMPYRLLHQTLGQILAHTAMLGTVSAFSQDELSRVLHIPRERICVIHNGVDHMRRNVPDAGIIEKLGLSDTPFFLCIGSLTKNKNVQLAVDAMSKLNHPTYRLVVVGGGNNSVFGAQKLAPNEKVIFAGRLSDAEIAGLLSRAQAFIFPSIYEGFGLPPLEAMHLGCPVLASNAQAVQEICGDAATYFDARNVNALCKLMREVMNGTITRATFQEQQQARLELFTWEKSARSLAHVIDERLLSL